MVLLHGLEHDRIPPVVSTDGDALADVRAHQRSLRVLADTLRTSGFAAVPARVGGGERLHRFERESTGGKVIIDVLAPEGLGPKTDLTTVPPGRTIEVPGGRQALNRSEPVRVRHLERSAAMLRPNLLGAIVGKATACRLPHGDTDRHYRDLAFLLSLVEDAAPLAAEVHSKKPGARKDRSRLAGAADLLDEQYAWAWALLADEADRAQGRDVFAQLLTAPARH